VKSESSVGSRVRFLTDIEWRWRTRLCHVRDSERRVESIGVGEKGEGR